MAEITKFEDIEAWRKGRDLVQQVYAASGHGEWSRDAGLRDQIRRAAVSVVSNIAEGFGRGGNKEFRQFLSQAKGSVSEVKAQLYVALDAGFISQSQFDEFYGLATQTENLIGGFMRYLARTQLQGAKYKPQPQNPEPRTQNP